MELPTTSYPARTRANVQHADAVLLLFSDLLGFPRSPGSRLTVELAGVYDKPLRTVNLASIAALPAVEGEVRDWLRGKEVGVLMVAGPRESKCPGIYAMAKAFLLKVLREGD